MGRRPRRPRCCGRQCPLLARQLPGLVLDHVRYLTGALTTSARHLEEISDARLMRRHGHVRLAPDSRPSTLRANGRTTRRKHRPARRARFVCHNCAGPPPGAHGCK